MQDVYQTHRLRTTGRGYANILAPGSVSVTVSNPDYTKRRLSWLAGAGVHAMMKPFAHAVPMAKIPFLPPLHLWPLFMVIYLKEAEEEEVKLLPSSH